MIRVSFHENRARPLGRFDDNDDDVSTNQLKTERHSGCREINFPTHSSGSSLKTLTLVRVKAGAGANAETLAAMATKARANFILDIGVGESIMLDAMKINNNCGSYCRRRSATRQESRIDEWRGVVVT